MEMVLLVLGYIGIVFVLVVQPVRMAWGFYLLISPPQERYLNVPVLSISIFIKALSISLAVYLYLKQTAWGVPTFDVAMIGFMIVPFVIYVMSEMIAKYIYHRNEDPF